MRRAQVAFQTRGTACAVSQRCGECSASGPARGVVWCSRRIEAGEASDPGSGRGAPGEGFGFSSRRDGKPLKKVASDSQKNNTACA